LEQRLAGRIFNDGPSYRRECGRKLVYVNDFTGDVL